MGKINREDMLELTRRMNRSRNCFSRAAGAYLDEEGFVDGTFNIHFLKLSAAEQTKNLTIAKAIPFAETNVKLKEYRFKAAQSQPGSVRQILMALKDCELKNDALLDFFYEHFGEQAQNGKACAVYFYYGTYDIPLKANDKESLWESEEIYKFLICAVCPLVGEYEPGEPECGFLFPAFKDRSGDETRVNLFGEEREQRMLAALLGVE